MHPIFRAFICPFTNKNVQLVFKTGKFIYLSEKCTHVKHIHLNNVTKGIEKQKFYKNFFYYKTFCYVQHNY